MSNERVHAVVLAGGKISSSLEKLTGARARAMIPVGGRTIIDRMADAIDATQSVIDYCVVCAEGSPLVAHVGDRAVVAKGPRYIDSVATGFDAFPDADRLLIITGDLPVITAQAIDHFCSEALQCQASIVYPIIRKEDCERAFPGGRRTYVGLLDGVFTGGNMAVFSREFIENQGDHLAAVYAARKNPVQLAAMLGWSVLLKLLIGRLRLLEVVERVEQMLHADCHVVISPYADVGFDVDKPSNLASIEAWLAAQPQRTTPD